jgi:cellulose synthase/poly-beta-1,6-N-acetylglucosamine synthase-like glycosyltransferase
MAFTALVYPFLFIALYFEVFLLLSFLAGALKKRPALSPAAWPSVTIFIPCYNEEKTVAKTLDSLRALDYPHDKLSIFAIDDGSKDSTLAVLNEYAATHNDPRIHIIHKENGGKHTALNLGLLKTSSEVVGCLDADSFVAPSALKESVRLFADPAVMAVTPAIKVARADTFIQHIQHAEYGLSAFIRRTFSWLNAIFITPGPFSMFRREVFEKLGPYKEAHNTEDMEIALRMQAAGMRIENAPDAHVFTNAPRSYPALYRQRTRWTYGFLKNAQDYRFMFFNPKYGTLGMFLLPLGIFTVLPGLYFTGMSVAYAAQDAVQAADRARVVGFSLPHLTLASFDWFYLNTSVTFMLTLALGAITVAIILIGKRIAGDGQHWGIALYLLFYGILAPWWLLKAMYQVAAHRKASWAAEIDVRRRTD